MAKRLFLILFSALFGIIVNPDFLAVAETPDTFKDLDQKYVTETIIEEPVATEEVAEKAKTEETAEEVTGRVSESTPIYYQPEPIYYTVPVPAQDSIQIAGRSINIYTTTTTSVDAGNSVMRLKSDRYPGSFLFGHNSYNVFGNITNLGVGDTFSATIDGEYSNYQISRVVIFEKDISAGKLRLNGTGSYMSSVAQSKIDGVQYDLSIMTCYGTSYGNGDASHRFVIFANKI